MNNNTVYQKITDQFLSALKEGKTPWRKAWTTTTDGCAYNYVTKKAYNGINQLLLGFIGNGGGYMTFKQINDKGYRLNKGSKGSMVVYWNWVDRQVTRGGQPSFNDDGTPEMKKVPFLKEYYVFSIADIVDKDGKPLAVPEHPKSNAKPVAIGEQIIKNYLDNDGPDFNPKQTNNAFYRPATDYVEVPCLDQYTDPAEYYSTAFHELTHSTGASKRLGRDIANVFGDHGYSKEELVAEIGSAMLCNLSGIETPDTLKNSKAYIQSWIKALKDDPKMIVWAAGQAQKAVNMIADGMIDEDGYLLVNEEVKETEEKPVETAETAETPVSSPAEQNWKHENGILTIKNGNATGTFKVSGILNMPIADIKKFKKEWLTAEMFPVFIEELKKNGKRYTSASKKKVLFTDKKATACDETKVINYITKQKQVHVKKVKDKYYITDSYMAIECRPEVVDTIAETNALFKELKDKGMLENAKCYRYGRNKEFEITPNAANVEFLFEKTDWTGDELDLNCYVKGETDKLYHIGDKTAVNPKMIDLFKEKVFKYLGGCKPLTRITDDYRAMVLPMRVA